MLRRLLQIRDFIFISKRETELFRSHKAINLESRLSGGFRIYFLIQFHDVGKYPSLNRQNCDLVRRVTKNPGLYFSSREALQIILLIIANHALWSGIEQRSQRGPLLLCLTRSSMVSIRARYTGSEMWANASFRSRRVVDFTSPGRGIAANYKTERARSCKLRTFKSSHYGLPQRAERASPRVNIVGPLAPRGSRGEHVIRCSQNNDGQTANFRNSASSRNLRKRGKRRGQVGKQERTLGTELSSKPIECMLSDATNSARPYFARTAVGFPVKTR